MQRLLIAAVSAAFLASIAAPVLADDYPPCTTPGQDHCRVVANHKSKHHSYSHSHHSHGPRAKKKP
jgi:hypothetical protein